MRRTGGMRSKDRRALVGRSMGGTMKRTISGLIMILVATCAFAGEAVLARVNGVPITAAAIEAEIDRMIPRMSFHGTVSEETRSEFREKALATLIDQELQHQDALARGIKPERQRVSREMDAIRDRYGSRAEYRKALTKAGITEDELRRQVERSVVIQAVVEKMVAEPSRVEETALRTYYERNKAMFRQPERVKLRIMTLKDEKKARDAREALNEGQDFGLLAGKVSEDNFRIKGGDVGYVHRGRLLPEVEDEAFKTKVGETSGLIKASGMWFIVKVEEKSPESQLAFEEIRAKLKRDLEEKQSRELLNTWMEGLRARAKIEKAEP